MTLRRTLLVIVALVLTVALVPVSLIVNTQLADTLDARARSDLLRAPVILRDRWSSTATVRMMHARDLASMPGVTAALAEARPADAVPVLRDAATDFPESPVLVDQDGTHVIGSARVPAELLEATRTGAMPVTLVPGDAGVHLLALAPVKRDDVWLGAAGGSSPMDDEEARALAGLTRSEVLILGADGTASGSTLDPERTSRLAGPLWSLMVIDTIAVVPDGDRRYLASSGMLDGGVKVFFLRDLDEELAVVPALRRSLLATSGIALVFALVLGGLAAAWVSRPVGALAAAADRLRGGDQGAPIPESRVQEVERLARAFRSMRETLAARLTDLEDANEALADRQERLAALQAELVGRERSLATGQLVSQLAHEIRNPIASIRNCLEVLRRRVREDPEAAEFADLAIEELLRMHELAEQTLAMNRPRDGAVADTPVVSVAREVARLLGTSERGGISVVGDEDARARIPSDSLKQVLLNLVLNAQEASDNGSGVEVLVTAGAERTLIQVLDRGTGIPEEQLTRIFDPFFTTKDDVTGVGLGLFTSEAIVRRYGGRISAANRDDGPGARFQLELPAPGAAE